MSAAPEDEPRRVSVVIASLKEPLLGRVLEALDAQPRSDRIGEILVVGRDAAGHAAVSPRARLLDTAEPVNAARARNLGLAEARFDPVVFLDADCLAGPTWLDEHLRAHAAGHAVVGGGVELSGTGSWEHVYNLTHFNDFGRGAAAGERPWLPTLNLSVRRRVIETAGPLDESLARSHDLEWTARMARAGFALWLAPEAWVRHANGRTGLAAVWRESVLTGAFSRSVRVRAAGVESSLLLRHRALLAALLPAAAGALTLRAVRRLPPGSLAGGRALPGLYLAKLGWCWGAARGRRAGAPGPLRTTLVGRGLGEGPGSGRSR